MIGLDIVIKEIGTRTTSIMIVMEFMCPQEIVIQ